MRQLIPFKEQPPDGLNYAGALDVWDATPPGLPRRLFAHGERGTVAWMTDVPYQALGYKLVAGTWCWVVEVGELDGTDFSHF